MLHDFIYIIYEKQSQITYGKEYKFLHNLV